MTALETEARAGVFWFPPPNEYPVNSTSIVYENLRMARGGAGRLYGFTVYNSNAAQQFILIFDLDGPLTAGAVPKLIYTVAGSAVAVSYWGSVGRWFDRGIVFANSSTANTYTAGAADCWFDVQVG